MAFGSYKTKPRMFQRGINIKNHKNVVWFPSDKHCFENSLFMSLTRIPESSAIKDKAGP